MRRILQFGILGLALIGGMSGSVTAQAIRIARSQAVSPNMAVSSMTVTASPSSVNFRLVSRGIATGSNAINITTTWGGSLCLLSCTINLYAYFSGANAALSGGGSPVASIPAAEVLGQVPTGSPTSFTAFTQSNPLGGAGASLLLFQQSFFLITGGGSRTDALNLEINLANQPQLPAGSYSGTLYIQAQSL
jgi:hypothetical protein